MFQLQDVHIFFLRDNFRRDLSPQAPLPDSKYATDDDNNNIFMAVFFLHNPGEQVQETNKIS